MSKNILEFRAHQVMLRETQGVPERALTHAVDLAVPAGQVVALVGESGSGKSITAMSVLGLLPPTMCQMGEIVFDGSKDLALTSQDEMRRIRGREIGMIFQEPMTALNPVRTIGDLLGEAVQATQSVAGGREIVRERSLELLRSVMMPDPEAKLNSYPFQLSGGQRQRAMIAMAISGNPRLLIADEPTTALDVTVQAEILDLILGLRERLGMAVLFITHDMGVVADIADQVVVMKDGEIVETADCFELFSQPKAGYTRRLLESVPRLGGAGATRRLPDPVAAEAGQSAGLVVDNISLTYGRHRRSTKTVVTDVSFVVRPGSILGLVGESGSGKTTVGRAIVGLHPVAAGKITLNGISLMSSSSRPHPHGSKVSIVFQDPASSLDPRRSIGYSITAPLRWNRLVPARKDRLTRARELLDAVQLPSHWYDRLPHELSGGQRQRVSIARALSCNPQLLIADEPTSALDVSVQAAVLDLIRGLQRDLGFSCLFISHDLAVVEELADSIIVLRQGEVVERGETADVLLNPQADYTQRLLAAAPVPDPALQRERRRLRQMSR